VTSLTFVGEMQLAIDCIPFFFFFFKQSDMHTNQHSAVMSNLVNP